MDPEMNGFGEVLFHKLKKYENNTSQINASTDEKETCGSFRLRSVRVAQRMAQDGLTSDDIISVCSGNNMDCYIPMAAAFFLGVKIANLDPILSVKETVHILNNTEPKIIFCCESSVSLLETCLKEVEKDIKIVVFGETEKHTMFCEYCTNTDTENNFVPTPVKDEHETAVIYFTSGSTGTPKGVCLSTYALQIHKKSPPYPVRILTVTRPYWISSLKIFISTSLCGGCRIFADIDENVYKHISDYQVNVIFSSALYAYKFTEYDEHKSCDLSVVKLYLIGGAPISVTQILKLRAMLPNTVVTQVYGLTETAGDALAFNVLTDRKLIEEKPSSVGKLLPGFAGKIVDEHGKTLGPNEPGEFRMKALTVMNGYYKNPEETKTFFDEDGYIKTGDMMYYDEDGCYHIIDRIKDIMKFQSWQIAPSELEILLRDHPDVQDAIVTSRTDEVDGDLPLGIVVRKIGSNCSEQELIEYIDSRVTDIKRLRGGIKFVDSIPITPTGKYLRRELRIMEKNRSF